MHTPKIYLAAPFFNEAQINVLAKIESCLRLAEIPFFSPLREGGLVDPADPLQMRTIYELNVEEIRRCWGMIAVLSYEGVDLYNVLPASADDLECREYMTPVRLPDTGTVWEMGMAAAMQKPILGYFPTVDPLAKLNVMLSQCLTDIAYGLPGLSRLLPSLKRNVLVHNPNAWKGGTF